MLRRTFLAASTLLVFAYASTGLAQNYPEKPVRIYQGFAAGGNADTIARLIGAELSKSLNQPFIVEGHTGAGGTIASTAVARANPDSYTLFLATGGHAVAGAIYAKPPYRAADDYAMISTATYFPFLIVTRADSPYQSLKDVLNEARTNPKGVSYGTAGVGTTHHLAGELLSKTAGVNLLHIPYRGDAASVTALLGGEIPFIIAPPTAVMPNITGGRLRALATTGGERWEGLPELPTVAEQGVDGYEVTSWAGFMAPAGTPPNVVETLNSAIQEALKVPEVRSRLVDMGGVVRGSTPTEMHNMVSAELAKWTQVVKDAGIPQQ